MQSNFDAARAALSKMGLLPVESAVYAKIPYWRGWYEGEDREFHHYKVYNGKRSLSRRRKSLNMAQRVCEDWANLLLNEKTVVRAEEERAEKLIARVLSDNAFSVYGNRLMELTFALGTGAFAVNVSAGKITVDFIRADSVFPLGMRGNEITECAFCSRLFRDGKTVLYVQAHTCEKDGSYRIRNAFFGEGGEEMPLPDGVLPEVRSKVRLFAVVTPNVVNKVELGSPLGASVFAGAIDNLCGCDLVFDSFCNDFQLGLKRIMIPVTMARMMTDEDGTTRPVFDENDVAFYAVPEDQKLTETDPHLRANEHIAALREQIDLLSDRCGLGTHRFCVDSNAGVKTATEVVSENSVLYQNLEKHRKVLERALETIARAILFLGGYKAYDTCALRVDFDDSIIQDKTAQKADDRLDVSLGVMPKWEYRAKWYGETEEKARAVLAEGDGDGAAEE